VPFVELRRAGLVLLGLWRLPGLILLGAALVTITVGYLVAEPIFSISGHIFPPLSLLVSLLIIPQEWDRFSVGERQKCGAAGA
jgi:hypothetical protein